MYVRDASIEVPDGPQVFMREYKPAVNVDLNTGVQTLGGDNYQVTLTVTVTAKQDQKLTFTALGGGVYSAPANLTPGVWEVEIDGKSDSVPDYHKIFRFFVKE